jgi:hypothetical protein
MLTHTAKLGALVLALASAAGQNTIPTGGNGNLTIHGRVTDGSGSRYPGVEVLATATGIRLPRLVLTDESGSYPLARPAIQLYQPPTKLYRWNACRYVLLQEHFGEQHQGSIHGDQPAATLQNREPLPGP